ncbi:hypothetical protein Unana1_06637 [Umbelopsis nana]
MSKQNLLMDDQLQRSDSDNLSMSNAVTNEQSDALPQLIPFGEVDQPITPIDDHSFTYHLEQSSLSTITLGGSAVFVDSVIEDLDAKESEDLSEIGNNVHHNGGDAKLWNHLENDTPPDYTLSTKLENGVVLETTVMSSERSGKSSSKSTPSEKEVVQPGGSLMDKLRVSEVFSAAKTRNAEDQNRPSFEFARHISGEQLQNILKSVNTKELLESSDSESVKETLMHIQQAALEEVQEQEEQKGVVDEMLEAIATSSGVSELAGAISEQLRSQEVIEEAAEREQVESDSTVLSDEDLQPDQLKEPEEPIIHVDLSACTSRASSTSPNPDQGLITETIRNPINDLMEILPPNLAKPMLDYDEYWQEYGLQLIVLLSIALLSLMTNILGY